MTKATPIDIASLTPSEREIQLDHPDGSGNKLPFWITIMSADDPRLKSAQRALIDKQNQKRQRNKSMSAEEMERGILQMLASAITGWRCEVLYNGEVPEFSRKKAFEMLSDSNIPWFFSQINQEMGDTESFFQK